MLTLLLILAILGSIVLVLFILAQNPKGGGLSSSFGGATQIIGARQTADFLEKASWYLAVGILFIVLISNAFLPTGVSTKTRESKMSEQIESLSIPQNPVQTQAQQQAQIQGQRQNPANQNAKPGQEQKQGQAKK